MIDFHTHIYPDKIAAATVKSLSCAGRFYPDLGGTAEDLREASQKRNIELAVILPVATNPLPEKVRHLNEFATGFDGKDGLFSFGGIHPDCPDWKEELKFISEAGMKGVKIHPAYQKVALNDIRYLRIIEEAASLGLIVITHMGYDVGLPGVKLCTPEMAADVVNKIGKFNFVLAHMGGWMDWKAVAEYIPGTGCYIDTSFSLGNFRIDQSTPTTQEMPDYMRGEEFKFLDKEEFCSLVGKIGADHVLFGSDSPWDNPLREAEFIRESGLPAESVELILDGNARKLLRL